MKDWLLRRGPFDRPTGCFVGDWRLILIRANGRTLGPTVVRKALWRSQMLPFFEKLPPCLVGAEACGTSHHWTRELMKLGHAVAPCFVALLARKPARVALVAMANKMARIAWAVAISRGAGMIV